MKTWRAYAAITGSKYLGEVKAETAEAAIEAAYDLDGPSLCHQCSDEVEDPEIIHVTVVCGTEEATDRDQPDPRTAEALRLQELVERCDAVGFAAPAAPGGDWIVETSSALVTKSPRLPEAVEAAIEELGK